MGRDITDFDFEDISSRKHIDDWLTLTNHKIENGNALTQADLKKVSELFKILLDNEEYKIPKYRSKRDESWKQLICWFVIKAERENDEISQKEAKEIAARKFCISEKTVERYCTATRKKLEKLINDVGFESVSKGFEHHLSRIKA